MNRLNIDPHFRQSGVIAKATLEALWKSKRAEPYDGCTPESLIDIQVSSFAHELQALVQQQERHAEPVVKTALQASRDILHPFPNCAARPESFQAEQLELPPLNKDLTEILGRPNFQCIRLANTLRKGGRVIEQRSEHEQAAVLHFMLGHYFKNGERWVESAEAELREIHSNMPTASKNEPEGGPA